MFGSGIGELNVYIRTIGSTSDPDKKIWGLNGDAGNNWYMAQAPVASSRPFKVHIFFLIVLRSPEQILSLTPYLDTLNILQIKDTYKVDINKISKNMKEQIWIFIH